MDLWVWSLGGRRNPRKEKNYDEVIFIKGGRSHHRWRIQGENKSRVAKEEMNKRLEAENISKTEADKKGKE